MIARMVSKRGGDVGMAVEPQGADGCSPEGCHQGLGKVVFHQVSSSLRIY
jgi:hypothetical protein